ncbi:MAG: hypothetical protein LBF54_02375 [Holosporaceae bacterium]|jgi:hypothetical protein|nr:hypothetical protein [Holosporaceae bacterium]
MHHALVENLMTTEPNDDQKAAEKKWFFDSIPNAGNYEMTGPGWMCFAKEVSEHSREQGVAFAVGPTE